MDEINEVEHLNEIVMGNPPKRSKIRKEPYDEIRM